MIDTPTKTPNFELLKTAYAVIDGIPADRIELSVVRVNFIDGKYANDPHHCGTIGCAMGWLALHPDFQALGLLPEGSGVKLVTPETGCTDAVGYRVSAMLLFGITSADARDLFSYRESWLDEDGPKFKTDKERLQLRIKKFLRKHGQL